MKEFLKQWRPYLVYGAVFSLFINIPSTDIPHLYVANL